MAAEKKYPRHRMGLGIDKTQFEPRVAVGKTGKLGAADFTNFRGASSCSAVDAARDESVVAWREGNGQRVLWCRSTDSKRAAGELLAKVTIDLSIGFDRSYAINHVLSVRKISGEMHEEKHVTPLYVEKV